MKYGTGCIAMLAMVLCARAWAQALESGFAYDAETYTVTQVESEPSTYVVSVADASALPIASKSKLLVGILLLALLGALAFIGSDVITKGKGGP